MADKRVLVFDPAEFFTDELSSVDRASFPGGFVNAGAAGAMGSQKLTGLAAATAANDALAHTQSGAVLDGLSLNSQKLTAVLAGTVGTDGVNKSQLDAVAGGFSVKEPVRVATTAALPANTPAGAGVGKTLTMTAVGVLAVDGVNTLLNDRILVKNEAAGVNNGIYDVTTEGTVAVAAILTRVTDLDQDSEMVGGVCTFINEGSSNANEVWCITTDNPITVDTTANAWAQISAAPQFTFGAGLLNTAGNVAAELDTTADAQGVGSGGGSSGLEFDAAGDAGQLRVRVDPAAGVQRNATGLGLEIDATPSTLKVDATGLGVTGLPSLFAVNGVAVGATVTAPNFDILTDGSNADALHAHAGSVATEAPKIEDTRTTTEVIAVGDPLRFKANNNVGKADAATPSANARVIGIARTADGVGGGAVEVVTIGPAAGVIAGATFNDDYWLQVGGGIATGVPTGGSRRMIRMGFAINATDLFVKIEDFGRRAA